MNGSSTNFNNNNQSGDIGSWIAVIVCLIVFWPVGLFLLLRKISDSTKNRNSSSYNPGYRYQQRYQQKYQKYQQYAQNKYSKYASPWQYYQQGRPQQQPWQAGGAGPQQTYQPGGSTAQKPYQNSGNQSGVYNGVPSSQKPYQSGTSAGGQVNQSGTAKQPYYQAQAPGPAKTKEAARGKDQSKAQDTGTQSSGAQNAPAERKQNSAKNLAVALTVLAVVLGIMGVIFLSSGLSALAVAGITAGNLAMTIFGGFSLLGAVISSLIRGTVMRRVRRFNKYAAVIGSRDIVSVDEISKAVGEPAKKTRKALQAMVDSGFYGDQAYIDSGLDSFVLSREAAGKTHAKSDTAAAAEGEKAEGSNQYVAIINELHTLCSQTSDPSICEKIERIEELTAKIFRIVEEKPEKMPQIRRFMNYYLPTTLKLLHSYQTLERQGIDGENITSAKQDIERILETLAAGFEQQLDNLFKADKLDISADINVLENLMEQDGLTSDGNIMKTAGGN